MKFSFLAALNDVILTEKNEDLSFSVIKLKMIG